MATAVAPVMRLRVSTLDLPLSKATTLLQPFSDGQDGYVGSQ
jgi:hypothetical protein